jgi:hypothetical protein
MNDHAGVYDTAVADVYRDDEYPYTFAPGYERNVYTSRTTAAGRVSVNQAHHVERDR